MVLKIPLNIRAKRVVTATPPAIYFTYCARLKVAGLKRGLSAPSLKGIPNKIGCLSLGVAL